MDAVMDKIDLMVRNKVYKLVDLLL